MVVHFPFSLSIKDGKWKWRYVDGPHCRSNAVSRINIHEDPMWSLAVFSSNVVVFDLIFYDVISCKMKSVHFI